MNKKTVMGIIAHVDAGKTTLSEAMLYSSGVIRQLGRVDHGDSFLDGDPLERQRGITIGSKEAMITWKDSEITLLDTPGHVDFSAETERSLMVMDAAILLVSGSEGVQSHTRTLWKLLREYDLPCIIYVNKMDIAVDPISDIVSDMQDSLSGDCVLWREPDDEFYEEIALCSEELLETYSETGTIGPDAIRRAFMERQIFPVVGGSALRQEGIEELLDLMSDIVLPPEPLPEFGARVYKISRDKSGSRLTHMRLYGGSLSVRQEIGDEKVSEIRRYNGEKYETLREAGPGDVVCVLGLSESRVRDGYGACDRERPAYIEPVLSYRVEPPTGVDARKLLADLSLMGEEDPALGVEWVEETGEVHIQIMGALQQQVIVSRIKDRFGYVVTLDAGRILYKETIKRPVEGIGHFEPLRHYAEIHLLLKPGEEGSGITVDSDCPTDVLGISFQKLAMTHVRERVHRGVLTGSPLTDIHVTVISGRSHPKHTEGGDFRQATYRAIRQGVQKSESILLEPFYHVTLTLPMEQIGRAMTDLNSMNGRIDPPEIEGDMATLTGDVPVACVADYAREVAAYTGGAGTIAFESGGYHPCHNTEEVIESIGYDPSRDTRNTSSSVFCTHGAGYQVPWYMVDEMAHVPPLEEDDPRIDGDWQVRTIGEGRLLAEAIAEGAGSDASGKGGESGSSSKSSSAPKRNPESYSGYTGMDSELEAIFVREFGPIKSPLRSGDAKVVSYDKEKEERVRRAREEYFEAHPVAKESAVKAPMETIVLVDGYNVVHQWEETKSLVSDNLDAARGVLLDMLSNYQGYTGERVIAVFDAYMRRDNPGHRERYNNVEVVFTGEDETADAYIERMAHQLSGKDHLKVVTSDVAERTVVSGSGALRVSCMEFHEDVDRAHREGMQYL